MPLDVLMDGLAHRIEPGLGHAMVSGISADTRRLRPGGVFVAIKGQHHDGHRLIRQAAQGGAAAVVAEEPIGEIGIPVYYVPNTRRVLGPLAARFWGDPSRGLRLIGVTGTNGKTTTTYLIESIFRAKGEKVGVIGTLNTRFNGYATPATNTTPEADVLQETLAQMLAHGVTTAVMEVSSHGLVQQRVRGCAFDAAVFTNLTQDHLDFHRDMEDYFQAKRRLFTEVMDESAKPGAAVILNADDSWARRLAEDPAVGANRWLFGLGASPMRPVIEITSLAQSLEGLRFEAETPAGPVSVVSPLVGRFNVSNLLAALAAAMACGVDRATAVRGLGTMLGVPGRLERVANGRGVHAFVDYAHTPDALERVGQTLGELREGRLIVVFGCGGDRDRGKRPRMAEAVARHATQAILTSDNPRTEDPERILDDAEGGFAGSGWTRASDAALMGERTWLRMTDRREAIRAAAAAALPGDTILVAGKGHEDCQILRTGKIRFDDREELADAFGR